MLDGIKRLFSRPAEAPSAWDAVVVWADQNQIVFRKARDDEGFVLEGHAGKLPWRLEWGASQRPYVQGPELRLRIDAGLPPALQAMVLDRRLQGLMEEQMFAEYVEGVQTRIDNTTPAEMRWLVMLNRLTATELGALDAGFAAVGSDKAWIGQWLRGGLASAMLGAPLAPQQPVVLMIARGRLTLRTALADPTPPVLDAWLRVFTVAVREARRTAERAAAETPSMPASEWAPGDEPADDTPAGRG